ncbi:ChacC and PUA domain-containing protein [Naegleria gruberi]|uniref:glutathione-specific gamma-glutamylcyclotransferase n=1 Tax=Naegleria gruberi TaxID=5762 RepID=D2VQD1_NAEGR|nr:ChacC and PUA domain-containing protein [Naegleria gruberi]EFC40926.1 ChacC and PUA domain-containing protein [Naegleria gruberi]|eukprot:XP_002673670.1 ChacC and PUA domain-containing protein [Naegleria gruberi strain NEG-M]
MCMGDIDAPLFIFAYGSVIWRPGFEYESSFSGFIKGFRRRFWLEDLFHRGQPNQEGRTLTIIRENDYQKVLKEKSNKPICSCQYQNFAHKSSLQHDINSKSEDMDEEIVWGTCYKVSFENAERVMKDLDYRELVAGYQKTSVKVYVSDTIAVCQNAIVYYFDPFVNREQPKKCPFIGPENICCSSKHIARAFGHSGPNRDYLYRLQEYLPVSDHYVDTLVHHVRALESHYPMNCSILEVLRKGEEKGSILVDQGATSALSQRCKNLLACGITKLIGEFERDDIVTIRDCNSRKIIAKGFSNFNSKEIAQMQGKNLKTLLMENKVTSITSHNNTTTLTTICNTSTNATSNHVIHHPTEVISKSRMILL